MFDWINFTPQRFLRPSVLAGMIIAILFLMLTLLAGVIEDTVNALRKRNNKNALSVSITVRLIGVIGILVGVLTVLLTI